MNRVRLTCCRSSSICAKSVLTVTSAMSPRDRPYFMSMPRSPVTSFLNGCAAARSVVAELTAYGFSSMFLVRLGMERPTSVAAICIWPRPEPPNAAGIGVTPAYSFFHRMTRLKLMPQSCCPAARKRSDLNGITISVDQPPSKRVDFTFHTVFQLSMYCPSAIACSRMPPSGLVWKRYPLRWS